MNWLTMIACYSIYSTVWDKRKKHYNSAVKDESIREQNILRKNVKFVISTTYEGCSKINRTESLASLFSNRFEIYVRQSEIVSYIFIKIVLSYSAIRACISLLNNHGNAHPAQSRNFFFLLSKFVLFYKIEMS